VSLSSASPVAILRRRESGFTLLELVAALALFAFIIIEILADREDSIELSADARVMQTVRYLAAAKMDEIVNFPDEYEDSQSGAFDEMDEEAPYQDFSPYTWDLEVERILVVGSGDSEVERLFDDEDPADFPQDGEGNNLKARYVRRVVLTVRFEPDDEFVPGLSVKLQTYLPDPEQDEEEGQ
jgi:prepilin-type N-terminal cleavage/methylation domain-containing protein